MGVGETPEGSRRTNRVLRLVGAAPSIARYGLVVSQGTPSTYETDSEPRSPRANPATPNGGPPATAPPIDAVRGPGS